MRRTLIALLVALALLTVAVAGAGAVPAGDVAVAENASDAGAENASDAGVDDGFEPGADNAADDRGSGEGEGPPGFVADRVPDHVGELLESLPVPEFLSDLFGR